MCVSIKKLSILLLLALLVSSLCGCVMTKAQWFYVDNAQLVNKPHKLFDAKSGADLQEMAENFVLGGHRIMNGGGVVIGYREFRHPFVPILDVAEYMKLSIQIDRFQHLYDAFEHDEVYLLPLKEATGLWSSGPSNFPTHSPCLGFPSEGYLMLERKSKTRIRIKLIVAIDPMQLNGSRTQCGELILSLHGRIVERKLSELTPWEGKIGKHIYDESMP